MSEMQITKCDIDSTAPAFYLYKHGELDPVKFEFTLLIRLKILTKEGVGRANFKLPASRYSSLRGITYNLEDGKIVESKLASESIFKERIFGDYYSYNLSMPNVKEGSVVDIEFLYPGCPREWLFQEEIPVKWSELILPDGSHMQFSKTFYGFERLDVSEDHKWIAKNMPSFKVEPYMNSPKNYITRFQIDAFSTNWEDLSNDLAKRYGYGEREPCLFLNPLVKDIANRYKGPEEKLKAAFDTLKIIKWNGKNGLFGEHTSLKEAFTSKSGNVTDINMMLIQLLRKLDIDADPVALSTRENGILQAVRPTPYKLNYTIARAKIDNKIYLLDATEEYAPYYILPLRVLNGFGRLINFYSSENVEITTVRKDKIYSIYDLSLDNNYILSGSISHISDEYRALDFRRSFKKFNSNEEFIEDFTKDKPGMTVKDFEIKNIENVYMPVDLKLNVQLKNQVINSGDQIYLYPMFYEQLKENIFKLETRNFPIDYGYNQEVNVVATIHIPDNFEIVEMPKQTSVKLPENTAGFYYKISAANNMIQINYRMNINKSLFVMSEYPLLREMFRQIVSKHSEPIILKKKA
jgi:hypothetical protein